MTCRVNRGRCHEGVHLIDLDPVDLPIGLREVLWVSTHESCTAVDGVILDSFGNILWAVGILGLIHISSPSAAKVNVDNDGHVGKVRIHVAGALVIDRWHPESADIRHAIGNALRLGAAREPPVPNVVRSPFSGIYAT